MLFIIKKYLANALTNDIHDKFSRTLAYLNFNLWKLHRSLFLKISFHKSYNRFIVSKLRYFVN